MEKNREVFLITEQLLQDKIYYVRGHKVMLNFDLAAIYGYTTKTFNQQVKIMKIALMMILDLNLPEKKLRT